MFTLCCCLRKQRLVLSNILCLFSSIPHDFFDEAVGSSIQEQKMLMDSDADVSPVVPLTAVSDQAALPSGTAVPVLD